MTFPIEDDSQNQSAPADGDPLHPKTIGQIRPSESDLANSLKPITGQSLVVVPELAPAASVKKLHRGKGWIKRLFSFGSRSATSVRSDLSKALARTGGDFTPDEQQMLHNILRLQDVRVEDLMVPRAEIEAIDMQTPLADVLTMFERSGHSRMPVFNETLDDPRGMVHIRDIVGYLTRAASSGRRSNRNGIKTLNLSRVDLTKEIGKLNIVRKLIFVPPSMMAAELMTRMQAMRIQIALVIDEYGGTEGLISLEDIVELIVGDIEDEHDDDEVHVIEKSPGIYLLDAKADIEDLRDALGGKFDVDGHDDDADTIGGVIFSILGRVPVKGEVVEALGYEFRIIDADPRRIKSIEMVKSKKSNQRKKQPGE